MALCLADALLEREGKIDPDLIGRNILDWALRFDAFNKNVLGPTSKIALNAIRDGKPVAELENNGVTNGAAMRVSPLGCLLPARDVDSFIDDVALASSPTHKSDLAVAGAVVIAWAISRAIDGESWSAIVDSLPSIARHAQQKRTTTFSASLAARLEIALKIVRNADGTESANPPANSFTRSLAQVPALLSPFRAPLRWLNWHKPTRTVAPSCALTLAATQTPSVLWRRQFAARCMALTLSILR